MAEDFRAIADVSRLRIAAVYGGVGIQAQAKRARNADIVIATPGRLLDLVERRLLRLDRVRIAVLDEADRMLDMGFLPDVTRILQLLRPERQTMLFSATLDGEVGRLAERFTHDPVRHEVKDDRPTVAAADHRFVSVDHAQKTNALVRELAGDRGLTLVFVRTKRGADRLAKRLRNDGFRVGALHGGMTQPARERALGHFASGDHDVLVATDVAARGLDLDDISHVINFDPPADEKAYVHRVGRTARAGRTGTGITFVTPDQRAEVGKMAQQLKLHAEFVDAGMRIDHGPSGRPAPGRNQPSRNRTEQPQPPQRRTPPVKRRFRLRRIGVGNPRPPKEATMPTSPTSKARPARDMRSREAPHAPNIGDEDARRDRIRAASWSHTRFIGGCPTMSRVSTRYAALHDGGGGSRGCPPVSARPFPVMVLTE